MFFPSASCKTRQNKPLIFFFGGGRGESGWRSGENAHFPQMCPESWENVICELSLFLVSCPCSESFLPVLWFPSLHKIQCVNMPPQIPITSLIFVYFGPVLLGLFRNRNTRNRRYSCSFGSYSVFEMNGISFRSFCSR